MIYTNMKAPGDTRPTWMNGIIQIHITRACDFSCVGCTQGSNLGGKPVIMTLENFENAVLTLRDYYGVVGIFGGNPVLHPQFKEICAILRKHIPFERRGLWSNNLRGTGAICRETFNPHVSNLNVHTDIHAYEEMKSTWPECNPIGLENDSRHSPPYVAMQDMEDLSLGDMQRLINSCDINKLWSAMLCQVNGKLLAYFCEIAGAQSMLHQDDSTGHAVTYGWWKKPIEDFEHQIVKHCFACGVPLRGYGDLAVNGTREYVSKTHVNLYMKQKKNRELVLVTSTKQLGGKVGRATDYINNGIAPSLVGVEK